MPTAMTFQSLQLDVQSYLERGTPQDPVVYNQLPELINFAERRISTEMKVLGFVIPATFTLQAGVAVYQKPDRWRKTVSLNIGTSPTGTIVRQQVYPRSYEYIREYWPDDTQTNFSTYAAYGPPKFYADYNYQNFIFAPTPDQAYPAELVYYEEPALLDATNNTNFITQYMPNLLLYATLLEATPFLKKDERVPLWQAAYDRLAAVYNSQSSDEIIDRSTTRQET
jgi:hypothetical protein